MIYLVSTFNEDTFKKIKSTYPVFEKNVSSVATLQDEIVQNGAPSNLEGIIIFSPCLEVAFNDQSLRKLSIILRSVAPNIKLTLVYTGGTTEEAIRNRIEGFGVKVALYHLKGVVTIAAFSSILRAGEEDEELAEIENSTEPPRVKVGIISLDPSSDSYNISSSVAFLMSKKTRGSVGYIETALSTPKVKEYLGTESSVMTLFKDTGVFNTSNMAYINANFCVSGVGASKMQDYKFIPNLISNVKGLDVAMFDLGHNLSVLNVDQITSQLDEIWVVLSPGPMIKEFNFKVLTESKVKDKVQIIFNRMDEYTKMKMHELGIMDGLETYIACEVPVIDSIWINRSLWESAVIPSIKEYYQPMSEMLNPLVRRLQ